MKWIKTYPLMFFVILSSTISFVAWFLYFSSQQNLISFIIPAEVIWLGEFGPAISAIITAVLIFEKPAFRDFMLRIFRWQFDYRVYLFILIFTPVCILLSILIDLTLSQTVYDWNSLLQWDSNFIARQSAFTPSMGIISSINEFMANHPFFTAIIFVILAITNGGLSEEIAWRGFVQDQLYDARKSLLQSSVIIAFIWALWHSYSIPAKMILSTPITETLSQMTIYIIQFLLLLIPQSFIYSLVTHFAKQSILSAVLFHADYNLCISIVTMAFPQFPMLIFIGIQWFTAFVLWLTIGKKCNESIYLEKVSLK